jgi:hypothetical protein
MVELVGIEPTASSLRTTGPAVAIRLIPLSSITLLVTFSIRLLDQCWDRFWDRLIYKFRQLRDGLALSCRDNLRVDVHRRRDAGMPHLSLDGLGIGASLYQPGSV